MSVRENTGETMARAKDEFMKQFGKDYGYPDAPKDIDEIRASEFKRLQGPNSIPPPWVRFPETRKWFGFCAVSWTVFLKPLKGIISWRPRTIRLLIFLVDSRACLFRSCRGYAVLGSTDRSRRQRPHLQRLRKPSYPRNWRDSILGVIGFLRRFWAFCQTSHASNDFSWILRWIFVGDILKKRIFSLYFYELKYLSWLVSVESLGNVYFDILVVILLIVQQVSGVHTISSFVFFKLVV